MKKIGHRDEQGEQPDDGEVRNDKCGHGEVKKLRRIGHRQQSMREHDRHETQADEVPHEHDVPQRILAAALQPNRQGDGRDSFEDIKISAIVRHFNREQLPCGQRCEKEFDRNAKALETDKDVLWNFG